MMKRRKINNTFWKKYFGVYDILNLCFPYQEMQREVVNELGIRPGELILDAGGGTGSLALKIKKKGAKVVVLDSSKIALEMCSKKNKHIRTIPHNLEKKLPFSDNYFDKIVSVNTLFFIDSGLREFVVREFYRVLKGNGKIILVNLLKEFRPIKIYTKHFLMVKERKGFGAALEQAIKFFIPSLKMLYYAKRIEREGRYKKSFFYKNEQARLLKKVGFSILLPSKKTYAGQAILTSAYK